MKRWFKRSPWFQEAFSRAEQAVKEVPGEDQLYPGWECYPGRRASQIYINWERRLISTTFAPVLPRDRELITLHGVSTDEFDALLSLFDPECVFSHAPMCTSKTDVRTLVTSTRATSLPSKNGRASSTLRPSIQSIPHAVERSASSASVPRQPTESCSHGSTTWTNGSGPP
jgi:hypothetical protein